YILSPFLGGVCSPQRRGGGGSIQLATPRWDNRENIHTTSGATDNFTDGLLGSVALPLLADFQTMCDQPDLPAEFGFIANGFNGWQISLTVQSGPLPAFRAFTGGTPNNCASPQQNRWAQASGQNAGGGIGSNDWRDNSLYWTMADFLKRQTVATSGFVEVLNPHRMPPRTENDIDPRLGPFFGGAMPATRK
ncbi:MAG: hypothetical protein KDC95_24700, partial [Planctomycetes bacterium]|nr:hypothetical protein [Planctomycetota bacterium]